MLISEIRRLQEKLNKLLENNNSMNRTEVLELSRQIDKLISQYYREDSNSKNIL